LTRFFINLFAKCDAHASVRSKNGYQIYKNHNFFKLFLIRYLFRVRAVLRQLDAVHHKGVRLALGTLVICRTKNCFCETGLAKLDEIKKSNSTKSAIRILTNTDHPIRPYFTNRNKLDEYGMRPRNSQPLFIRTAEFLGETQIDIRRIEVSLIYNKPSWKPVNEKQFDVRISTFGPGTSCESYRTETARTLDEDYGKHITPKKK
jgi:hypothetical protein